MSTELYQKVHSLRQCIMWNSLYLSPSENPHHTVCQQKEYEEVKPYNAMSSPVSSVERKAQTTAASLDFQGTRPHTIFFLSYTLNV